MTHQDHSPASPAPQPRPDAAVDFTADPLDQAILRALRRDPRAPFADIAAATGVHERTIARRLERMTATGQVGFTAALVPEYLGEGLVAEVAVRCAPGHVQEVARALARRPDVRSVEAATGTLDVYAEFSVPGHEHLLSVVDGPLGQLPGVTDLHSSIVLRLLLTANDWAPFDDEPTPVRRAVIEGRTLPEPPGVDELDRAMVALLESDARMPMTRLARELCVGETTARRRLARLMSSHVLHVRLHAEPVVLGFPVEARFRLAVDHGCLDRAVQRLARESTLRHLVVTTGRYNVLGYSSHRTAEEVHDFSSRAFAGLPGVNAAETALLMRTFKRAGVPVAASSAPGRRRP
ncbi:Lrp/AsnC family transcriptional regulator [Streptomyces sp. NPDC050658]|uniref:Lrp/AsnC family transcriptional regulator n=1 Tax=unclassified Streptomyces TaxID=2593676 RepID=UPI0034407D7A